MYNLKPLDYQLLEIIKNNPKFARHQVLLSQESPDEVMVRIEDMLKDGLIVYQNQQHYLLTKLGSRILNDYQHQQKLEQERLAKEETNKWYDRIWNSVLTLLSIITEFIKSLFIFALFYQSFIKNIIR